MLQYSNEEKISNFSDFTDGRDFVEVIESDKGFSRVPKGLELLTQDMNHLIHFGKRNQEYDPNKINSYQFEESLDPNKPNSKHLLRLCGLFNVDFRFSVNNVDGDSTMIIFAGNFKFYEADVYTGEQIYHRIKYMDKDSEEFREFVRLYKREYCMN